MTKHYLRIFALSCALLLLHACVGAKTPQDVAEAFWAAVIDDDAEEAVRYSTLTEAQAYDGFGKDWTGYRPRWGRVVIDGDQATVAADFVKPDSRGDNTREVVTYLVRRDDEWRVDYARTAQSVRGSVVSQFLGRLEQWQDELSTQFDLSAREFEAEMERLAEEAAALSESISRQASETMDEYARALSETLQELRESVERALSDKEGDLSDHDRRVLREVSRDLEESQESLDEPDLAAIVSSGETVVESRLRLETTDDGVVGTYKQEWREWTEQFKAQMRELMTELSAYRYREV